jgi:hypothetical protein
MNNYDELLENNINNDDELLENKKIFRHQPSMSY